MEQKKWYATKAGNDFQGLVIDEETGKNIAVAYDVQDAKLLAASPELLEFAEDIYRYLKSGSISTKSDKNFVLRMAYDVIQKAKEG